MRLFLTAVIVSLCQCEPADIREVRMGYAPAHPRACDIKVVSVPLTELGGNGRYDMLGYIIVSGDATDPFDTSLLSEIRPRACRMGGEQLTLTMGTQGNARSTLTYAVLKPREM